MKAVIDASQGVFVYVVNDLERRVMREALSWFIKEISGPGNEHYYQCAELLRRRIEEDQ